MRLWIDDLRSAPEGYVWCKSVNDAKSKIEYCESWLNSGLRNLIGFDIEVIDIDHDAGDYASDGGDYIRLLDWLEETGRDYPIRIHSMNPVGVENMRRIIERNGWKEIK